MTLFRVLASPGSANSDFYTLAELGQKFEEAIDGVSTHIREEASKSIIRHKIMNNIDL